MSDRHDRFDSPVPLDGVEIIVPYCTNSERFPEPLRNGFTVFIKYRCKALEKCMAAYFSPASVRVEPVDFRLKIAIRSGTKPDEALSEAIIHAMKTHWCAWEAAIADTFDAGLMGEILGCSVAEITRFREWQEEKEIVRRVRRRRFRRQG